MAEIGEKSLILQQLILGETVELNEKGKPTKQRAIAAILCDQSSGDTFAVPWNPREGRPVLTIRTLVKLDPELASEVKNALRRAPKQKVKR